MSGWVSISRDIFSHDFFPPEPLTEREAWLWLIINAAWRETAHRVGSKAITVERGSLITTLRTLQKEWRWNSVKRVRNFLDALQASGMAGHRSVGPKGTQKTHLTICNYDKFQNVGHGTGTTKKHEVVATGHIKETNNKKQGTSSAPNFENFETAARRIADEIRDRRAG